MEPAVEPGPGSEPGPVARLEPPARLELAQEPASVPASATRSGLRRTAYEVAPDTGLFEPEYVNVFGVPFTFLPHEGGGDGPPPPPEPKTAIEPDKDKAAFAIRWPNVVRSGHRTWKMVLILENCV